MSSRKFVLIGVLILLTVGVFSQLAKGIEANPSGAVSIANGSSSIFNGALYSAANHYAEAGNITHINISGKGPTKSWQGYYGEVTGTISLEDSNGNELYDWSDTEPQGQIYASTASSGINWDEVKCMNVSGNVNWATEEAKYDIAADDADGITETFTQNNHPNFYIGYRQVTGCNTTWTYISNATQTARYPMILLEDDVGVDATVYATWIENRDDGNSTDVTGFDGSTHDFQFMVPENGSADNRITTAYYFWVAIY